jgi:hypothetical protein
MIQGSNVYNTEKSKKSRFQYNSVIEKEKKTMGYCTKCGNIKAEDGLCPKCDVGLRQETSTQPSTSAQASGREEPYRYGQPESQSDEQKTSPGYQGGDRYGYQSQGQQYQEQQYQGQQSQGQQYQGQQFQGQEYQGQQYQGQQYQRQQSQGQQYQGHQSRGHQPQGKQYQGHQSQEYRNQGHQYQGQQNQGYQPQGHQPHGYQNQGHHGQGQFANQMQQGYSQAMNSDYVQDAIKVIVGYFSKTPEKVFDTIYKSKNHIWILFAGLYALVFGFSVMRLLWPLSRVEFFIRGLLFAVILYFAVFGIIKILTIIMKPQNPPTNIFNIASIGMFPVSLCLVAGLILSIISVSFGMTVMFMGAILGYIYLITAINRIYNQVPYWAVAIGTIVFYLVVYLMFRLLLINGFVYMLGWMFW